MDASQRLTEASAVAERILSAAGWTMAGEASVPLMRMRELSMDQYTRLMNESGATFDDAARALEACNGDLVDTILELTCTRNNCPDVLRVRAQRRERLRRAGSGLVHVIERTRRLHPVPEPEPLPAPEEPAPETGVVEEDTEALVPIALPFHSFTAADGSTWTHTSERGWSREAAEEEPSVEQRAAINAQTDMLEAWVVAQQERDTELLHQRGRLNSDWRNGPVHVRNRIRFLLHETLIAHAEREAILGRQVDLHEPWTNVLRAVRSWDGLRTTGTDVRATIDRFSAGEPVNFFAVPPPRPEEEEQTVGRAFYVDDVFETASESEPESSPMPARLASESSASSSEEDAAPVSSDHLLTSLRPPIATDPEARRVRINARWPHAAVANRLGSSCRAAVMHDAIKQSLRDVQEMLDAELAAAAQGTVFSEGSYLNIMEAIKRAWEANESARVTRV